MQMALSVHIYMHCWCDRIEAVEKRSHKLTPVALAFVYTYFSRVSLSKRYVGGNVISSSSTNKIYEHLSFMNVCRENASLILHLRVSMKTNVFILKENCVCKSWTRSVYPSVYQNGGRLSPLPFPWWAGLCWGVPGTAAVGSLSQCFRLPVKGNSAEL